MDDRGAGVAADRPAAGVVVLTLDRPAKNNALSAALLTELAALLRAAFDDPATRAVVLTGTDPAFCSGVDLDAIAEGADFPLDAIRYLRAAPVPVIAAVNGAAVTGGLELALACDFRIGSERARFADTHARLGFAPAWGMTARLPQAVGQAWARQISLTGSFVDAATALRIGLLNELVAHDRLVGRAVELAVMIARTDPDAARRVRDLYGVARDASGREALEAEAQAPHVTPADLRA
ncbi:enoyl-CoA hydratase [Actinomadura sp. GTD37]|uniref:enoyl-CoA hydratase n=1 Tax=Actinomadura sp. GTD37 TaxID=1778030 RepID=UPI0035C0B1F1